MNRAELILAALSPTAGTAYTPLQTQKMFFLLDRQIPELLGGPLFDFKPYDCGPFDKAVYQELEQLAQEGSIEIELSPGRRLRKYLLTEQGQVLGAKYLESLDKKAQEHINNVSHFVSSLSFEDLVSSIYKAFPKMKANSVFRG